jgi:uncharacterized protein (DUF1697 family)
MRFLRGNGCWYTIFMMYVALFRGLNAGGESVIKMVDLKQAMEELGFSEVRSYLPSGNIVFKTERDFKQVTELLEKLLRDKFKIDTRLILKDCEQMRKIVREMPADWDRRNDLRRRVVFIREPLTAADVLREVELREGIDFLESRAGVVYMSTLMSSLTKSRFTRLITKPVYKELTIRDYATVQKIAGMMGCS